MNRDDRDDPFDDIFSEIERMMNEMIGGTMNVDFDMQTGSAGFGADTHIDIHESDDDVRIIADLPGVEKDAIDLTCDGRVLTISASSQHREYDERIQLPHRVDEHSANASYNNGVLEVVFDREDDSTGIDVR